MLRLLIFFLITTSLFSSKVESLRWSNGISYLVFLEKNNLPTKKLYYDLDKDDQTLTEEIRSRTNYQVLKNTKNEVIQLLIPLNDELQIHIYKYKDNYFFEAIPIISHTKREAFVLKISHSPHYDIIKATGSKKLAQIFVENYKYSLNFKRDLKKGDTLVMMYDQKYRLGIPFSMPILKAAMIEMRGKKHYIYLNEDERYYNEKAHEIEGFLLARPVKNARISSYFTKKRFHPILKKYRAHLGVDYAARRGTPIVAAGNGRISFIGRNRGYGNLIKIRHADGYTTLYAHQKSFRKGMKKGKYVKKGQTIGYVGTTGLSTGPHLHFGLYKHGRAINPLRVVQVTTKKLKGKAKKSFLRLKENYNQSLNIHLTNNSHFIKEPKPSSICYFNGENIYE
ncbi:MAG: peptidoglycan DD-metalloendopeptidase family protein [Sulfurimonas sp.]|nr:peptidoglycan DD-metalloendopeptidase family protein [Sulfurimonas sp.]